MTSSNYPVSFSLARDENFDFDAVFRGNVVLARNFTENLALFRQI